MLPAPMMMLNQQQQHRQSSYYHHQQQQPHHLHPTQPHHLLHLPHHHQSPPLPPSFHPHAATHYHDPALASLAYRPLQLPLLQQTTHQQHQQQQQPPQRSQSVDPLHHRPPQQLPLAAAAAAASGPYQHPSFRQRHSSLVSHRTRAQSRLPHAQSPRTMADYSGHQTSDEERAELQKLSEQYQPETHGPLVGQRQPSTALASEYASADPTYQAKTATLPQKYSHYRTVRGDGNCGWRAVAFGYFEALIHYGDSTRFSLEEARLVSLNNVMTDAGFDPMLFEDFTEATCNLLRDVQKALSMGNAEEVLLEQFNDEMLQNYIITHLRTLTASWMKTREENYAPWLLGQTVQQYCESSVLPVAAEIDNVGLVALKDALLSPAGLSLEVLYLDRSEGNEVTMHRFDPASVGSYPVGFVRVLYRPGHYDIIYKQEDLPAPPPPPVATYLQFASQDHQPVYEVGGADFMTAIPGMSFANLGPSSWLSSSSYGTDTDFFTPAAVQTCTQPLPTPSAPAPQPQISSQPVYVPTTTPTQMVPPPSQLPHELSIRTSVPHATLARTEFQHQLSGGPFRPSAWQLEPDFVHATSQMPFQTSIFRNSHFNTAHFLNPDFQPEQWDPEDEYATTTSTSSSKSSRHKNSG